MLRAAFRARTGARFQQPSDFSGQVAWQQFSDEQPPHGTEIFFEETLDGTVRIGVAGPGDLSHWHYVEIHVDTAIQRSPLAATIHTVFAPAFDPGGFGVDWEDVMLILRAGKKGFLKEVADVIGDDAVFPYDMQIARNRISASIGVASIPRGQPFRTMTSMLSQFIKELDPGDQALRMVTPLFTDERAAFYSLLLISR